MNDMNEDSGNRRAKYFETVSLQDILDADSPKHLTDLNTVIGEFLKYLLDQASRKLQLISSLHKVKSKQFSP